MNTQRIDFSYLQQASPQTSFVALPMALFPGMSSQIHGAAMLYAIAEVNARRTRQPRTIFERDLFCVWN